MDTENMQMIDVSLIKLDNNACLSIGFLGFSGDLNSKYREFHGTPMVTLKS